MAKRGLGKGLNALFKTEEPTDNTDELINSVSHLKSKPIDDIDNEEANNVTEISINLIEPNKKQARKKFDAEKLEALSESISEHGIIQPILLAPSEDGRYTIIAGERRWRAAKKIGLMTVPVIIRELSEIEAAQVSLIENLQRENLNPIEEAAGYRALIDEFSLTQEEISKKLGKSRSAVANSLRLLSLGENITAMLVDGVLSAGHARALLALENEDLRLEAANLIIDEDLNVRQTEQLVKKLIAGKQKKKKQEPNEELMVQLNKISDNLCSRLGTKVHISHGDKKGKIEIEYYGNDDLERILGLMNM